MNKVTKGLVMASSILLLSANAYAARVIHGEFSHYSGEATFDTGFVDTKNKAYTLGAKKLKELRAKSSRELSDEIGLRLDTVKEKNSVSFEEGYITVQELMNEQGDILFKGTANVIYHYSVAFDEN